MQSLSIAVKYGHHIWGTQVTLLNNLSFRSTDQVSSVFWCGRPGRRHARAQSRPCLSHVEDRPGDGRVKKASFS
jgi:hypothetical protein